MGGGGFTMQERSPALDRLVLTLTGKPVPKVCFLPTASGDPREQTTRFYERFAAWPCEPSILSLFHLGRDRIDPVRAPARPGRDLRRRRLDAQHARRLARARRRRGDAAAWEAGVVLAGLSAGAMCWFQGGITMSGGAPAPVAGLGPAARQHVGAPGRRARAAARLPAAVASGSLPAGYAVDDGAALLFDGERLSSCVASEAGARVIRVRADGDGGVIEQEMPVRVRWPGLGRHRAAGLRVRGRPRARRIRRLPELRDAAAPGATAGTERSGPTPGGSRLAASGRLRRWRGAPGATSAASGAGAGGAGAPPAPRPRARRPRPAR